MTKETLYQYALIGANYELKKISSSKEYQSNQLSAIKKYKRVSGQIRDIKDLQRTEETRKRMIIIGE